ncbi:penicillin-binding protein 1A [Shewanella surugensis]|uniref:Penicillin-binding protein 1A n=1 Tax=Shewanella surugensis TaxID=212020 RepID=A0ABT0LCY5_9GAMM|nr:PBP1A family penicillin-binding protein [Shewanella surugensis]MCL1125558.1 PBP1A family penicillin-binding protein [Shewanella surugensis]
MKWFKRLTIAFFSLALLGIIAITAAYYYVLPDLPDVNTLKTVKLQIPLRIYTSDGKLISQFGEKRRIPLELQDIPKPLLQAFIATEDNRFYEHQGIDPIGLVRAALVMITTGKKKQGASTITMQVARNFFLTRDKTLIRKIKEIFISIHIEQLLTKDEILTLYVNRIYLGQRAYGVGAAAQVYYGKDVADLTLPEMAMIAGLPKAPSTMNPITSRSRALSRRNVVLMRMHDVGYINDTEYTDALKQPLTATYHGAEIDLYAPYMAEMARDYLVSKLGEEEAYTGGYDIYTTIDSTLQLDAQQALRDNVYAYDQRHGYRGRTKVLWTDLTPSIDEITEKLKKTTSFQGLQPAAVMAVTEQTATVLTAKGESLTLPWDGLKWARRFITHKKQGPSPKAATDVLVIGEQVWIRNNSTIWQLSQVPLVSSAIVSIEPHDGAIKALVGGFSFFRSQYNRVTQAKRQLGSNIKPFIYTAALEKGYTLATLINNAPINQPDTRQGIAWRPKNSPDVYGGPTRLRLGLAQSINVMSVRTMRYSGLNASIKELTKFGFDPADLPRNESLALGSASVTPLQVVTAFSTFANGGYLVEPFYIQRIETATGDVIEQANPTLACTPTPVENDPVNSDNLSSNNQLVQNNTMTNNEVLTTPNSGTSTAPQDQHNKNAAGINQCGGIDARFAPQIISHQTAFLISDALKSVIWGGGNWSKGTGWNGTAWRASRDVKRHDISGKTGTTNESRDTWFSGFNPTLATTVWVGFDDHAQELGRTSWDNNGPKSQIFQAESGAKTAGPAWNEFMKNALAGTPEIPASPPAGIISVRIDLASGKLSHKTDYTSRFEYFVAGTEPTEYATETNDEGNIFIDNSADDLFQ